jgi:ABC-2 type transport system permease protein
MNNLRGIYTIWYRDMLRFWHDRVRLVGAIFLPLLFLFVFGSGFGGMMGNLGSGVNFAQFIFPGIIGMTVLMSSFMAGISVVWDREFGFLKEVLVAPINRASVATGKTLGAATVAMIQGSIIMLFAPLIGVALTTATAAAMLPLMFLLAITMGAFGVLLATRIRSMEAFQVVTQMLLFPMIFLSGVFIPLDEAPAWMSNLTKINPATYGITSIRQVALGETSGTAFGVNLFGQTMSLWNNVGILAVIGAVMILLAIWSFRNQE